MKLIKKSNSEDSNQNEQHSDLHSIYYSINYIEQYQIIIKEISNSESNFGNNKNKDFLNFNDYLKFKENAKKIMQKTIENEFFNEKDDWLKVFSSSSLEPISILSDFIIRNLLKQFLSIPKKIPLWEKLIKTIPNNLEEAFQFLN
ncbi:hypothetical protein M0811_00227 [Anaeramoeba ignava]|uniref:Uncharacterized protein n=1 Tax=Anaeramoeba ignava TaxID=1746090 RepID=A0A9Q0LPZ0_ANAIG|nr:hypothetical protein M0811_00227 [Anaeramoeba ignava]